MRNLNLGPDTQKLIDNYRKYRNGPTAHIHEDDGTVEGCPGCFWPDWMISTADDLAKMLERWIEVAWCWTDACPANVCRGPHVLVRYHFTEPGPWKGGNVDVVEPLAHVGETFPEADYAIVTRGQEGHIIKRAVPVAGSGTTELPTTRHLRQDDQPER